MDVILVEDDLARLWKDRIIALKGRARTKLRFIPVLVVSSQGNHPEKWLSLGFDDVLTIPIAKRLFQTRIANLLRLAEETSERLREWVETMAVGFYRVDPSGRILYANRTMAQLLGFSSPPELVERDLEEEGLRLEPSQEKLKELVAQQGGKIHLESVWRNRNEEKIIVLESVCAVRDQNGNIIFYEGTLQDITPMRKYQEKLNKVGNFGRNLVSARTAEKVAQVVVEAARDMLGTEDCGLFLVDKNRDRVELLAHALGTPLGPTSLPLYSERGIVPHVARTGHLIHLPDVRSDQRFIPGALPSQSELCLPLKVGEEVIGVLDIQSARPAAFGPEETRLAEALADVAAIALKNARLLEEVERAKEALAREVEERQKLLDQVVAAFSAAMGLKDPYTAKHQRRVALLCCAIAEELGLPPERRKWLQVAALLHDGGKVLAVPNEISSKPGKLTE